MAFDAKKHSNGFNQSFFLSQMFAVVILAFVATAHIAFSTTTTPAINTLAQTVTDYTTRLNKIMQLSLHQTRVLQHRLEESVRANKGSGIISIRRRNGGTMSYHANGAVSHSALAIHDHANNIRTVGMGEVLASLNGVEFRTRHNDYQLKQPHSTSSDYNDIEPIKYPDVPKEVSDKATLQEQIVEMREFFRAFKEQNTKIRDYRPYFRPVLVYMEGWWAVPEGGNDALDDSTPSDRHSFGAKTYNEMYLKSEFSSYTGRKDSSENWAHMPSKIIDIVTDKSGFPSPLNANWNYRILGHPLRDDLPLDRLRAVLDIATQFAYGSTPAEHNNSRRAIFKLDPLDTGSYDSEAFVKGSLLDRFMAEVPGKDNYQANLKDDLFGYTTRAYNSAKKSHINSGFYHRLLSMDKTGAMGQRDIYSAFNDPAVFFAMNTQNRTAKMSLTICDKFNRNCKTYDRRYSFAIPMEIIYLTPLQTWNPLKLAQKGDPWSVEGRTVTAGGSRTGGATVATALNGTHDRLCYTIPESFFSGNELGRDTADTTKVYTHVLDPAGKVNKVRACGIRIFLPNIPGVGSMRTRYPIAPLADYGNNNYKRIEATLDLLMNMNRYQNRMTNVPNIGLLSPSASTRHPNHVRLVTAPTTGINSHTHEVFIPWKSALFVKTGGVYMVRSTSASNHDHRFKIVYKSGANSHFEYETCDGKSECADKHPRTFTEP